MLPTVLRIPVYSRTEWKKCFITFTVLSTYCKFFRKDEEEQKQKDEEEREKKLLEDEAHRQLELEKQRQQEQEYVYSAVLDVVSLVARKPRNE